MMSKLDNELITFLAVVSAIVTVFVTVFSFMYWLSHNTPWAG